MSKVKRLGNIKRLDDLVMAGIELPKEPGARFRYYRTELHEVIHANFHVSAQKVFWDQCEGVFRFDVEVSWNLGGEVDDQNFPTTSIMPVAIDPRQPLLSQVERALEQVERLRAFVERVQREAFAASEIAKAKADGVATRSDLEREVLAAADAWLDDTCKGFGSRREERLATAISALRALSKGKTA